MSGGGDSPRLWLKEDCGVPEATETALWVLYALFPRELPLSASQALLFP